MTYEMNYEMNYDDNNDDDDNDDNDDYACCFYNAPAHHVLLLSFSRIAASFLLLSKTGLVTL